MNTTEVPTEPVAETFNDHPQDRKLATIREVGELFAIPDADAIEACRVDGWVCVVKKGAVVVGQKIVFFEVDSFLPKTDARFAFLGDRDIKKQDGAEGWRLRTIRLRKQLSQGLVLPLGEFPELGDPELGSDVTLVLGIRKWDPPVSGGGGGLGGGAPRGNFPGFITKTDQERVQNLIREVFTNRVDEDYEVTMKLDGTSFTAYVRDGEVGVCSRNLDLKLDGDFVSPLVRFAQETGLLAALQGLGRNLAVQGELMGPGIQKNREELPELRLFIFDIQDLDQHQKLLAPERQALAAQLSSASDPARILHAPVLHVGKLPARDLASMLEYVEGPSLRHPVREGLVFKSLDSGLTFKAISNKFLLKSE